MKKLILSALMALSCGALFAADTDMYLFWMIADEATASGGGALPDDLTGYNARISDGSNYLTLYSALPDDGGTEYANKMVAAGDALGYGFERWASIDGYDNSSTFIVELLQDGNVVYQSDSVSYAALAGYISSSKGMAQPADAYGFSSFTAVPEPTSGLLLLLGVAGLALRRKKMQKA